MHLYDFGIKMMYNLSHEYAISKISADISLYEKEITFWVLKVVIHRPNHKVNRVVIILIGELLALKLLLLKITIFLYS